MRRSASGYLALNSRNWRRPGESFLPRAFFFPVVPDVRLVLGGLLVGTLAYGASIALYITAAQQLGATRAQMVFATAPFFGAGLSVLTLALAGELVVELLVADILARF